MHGGEGVIAIDLVNNVHRPHVDDHQTRNGSRMDCRALRFWCTRHSVFANVAYCHSDHRINRIYSETVSI